MRFDFDKVLNILGLCESEYLWYFELNLSFIGKIRIMLQHLDFWTRTEPRYLVDRSPKGARTPRDYQIEILKAIEKFGKKN